ncbi:DMT family transporter [Georgenia halophila]|uniref:DMT family transporter n=1 Tax=Georgenia halophila TaxID=620889 RepID=A0ABP8KYE5_9MICO
MGVVLALLSALSYGVSDVVGGLAARRMLPVRVALVGQIGGLLTVTVVVVGVPHPPPEVVDLAWGALSGVGTGAGMAFLFRGMSRGAMSIVVPLSAVGGVALPVLVSATVLGERPPGLTWLGVSLALPALWLITRTSTGTPASRASLVDGLAAGVGIAIQYLCLAQAGAGSGLWPVLSGRVAAIVTVLAAAATIMRGSDGALRQRGTASTGVLAAAAGAGVLAAAALAAYLFALRTEFVTATVVLSSLYPVVPVVVGLVLLRERLRRRQVTGLVAALGATVLIAIA